MTGDLFTLELTFVGLLLLVSVVAMIVHRIRIPYTVALVLVGLALSFQKGIHLELTPELILLLFLPPLVFEAALHIDYRTFRRIMTPILLLAVFGILIAVAVITGLLMATGLMDWRTALVFASLIAATDPVAVVSLFKVLGAPKRLATLVESESLFNDATTIVVFHIVVGALSVSGAGLDLNWFQAVEQFVLVAAGGVVVGVIGGLVANLIFAHVNDHLIEITLSTIAVYGTYLLAEQFHLSGVLAVVLTGMIIGNRSSRNMSPTTRMMLMNFWEYIAFLANSLIFILIGTQVVLPRIGDNSYLLFGLVIIIVLISRAITVYGLSFVSRLLGNRVPHAYQHVMFWGGLRGAVSLALALSISRTFPNRDLILTLTFVVVFFTLLVQATTISPLLRKLGLVGLSDEERAYEFIHGRLLATWAAYAKLKREYEDGALDPAAWNAVKDELSERIQALNLQLSEFAEANPELISGITAATRREALKIQRTSIIDMQREGILSDEVARGLIAEIDEAIDALDRPQAQAVEAIEQEAAPQTA